MVIANSLLFPNTGLGTTGWRVRLALSTALATMVLGGYGGRGIYADNKGSGNQSISTTGLVTGTTGIRAQNSGADTTVSVNEVTGTGNGIFVFSAGSGTTNVSASGVVTGGSSDGIFARNYGTDLTVSAATDVSGRSTGIKAHNAGAGALSVTSAGTATGTYRDGIYALNRSFSGTNLSVEAATASGGYRGIFAKKDGTGWNSRKAVSCFERDAVCARALPVLPLGDLAVLR